MRSLTWLQQWLQRVYEIEVEYDVMDFLITDRKLVRALQGGEARPDCPEKLLLRESPEEMAMSLYLSPEVLQALGDQDTAGSNHRTEAFCQAVEGVSHFLYLAWRAGFERELTQFELELQAEIDKFIGLVTLNQEADRSSGAELCSWLFDRVSFESGLDNEHQERYEVANFYAGHYCRQLSHRYLQSQDGAGLTRELRRFYRQGQHGKLDMIQSG
jgi:hypothetical protein